MRRVAELARFVVVSVVGTGIDFLVLWLLVAHARWTPVPAKVIAIEATIITSFVCNNAWTFRARVVTGSLARRFLTFNLASAGSFALGLATIALLVALFGPRYYLVYNAVTLPLNAAWTYLWSVRVIWSGRERAPGAAEPPVGIGEGSGSGRCVTEV